MYISRNISCIKLRRQYRRYWTLGRQMILYSLFTVSCRPNVQYLRYWRLNLIVNIDTRNFFGGGGHFPLLLHRGARPDHILTLCLCSSIQKNAWAKLAPFNLAFFAKIREALLHVCAYVRTANCRQCDRLLMSAYKSNLKWYCIG